MGKLIRHGECKRCGSCCGKCPYLAEPTLKEDGVTVERLCTIWETCSDNCKIYPTHPLIGFDDECGFYFTDEDTGKIVTAKNRIPRDWNPVEEFYTYYLMGYEYDCNGVKILP